MFDQLLLLLSVGLAPIDTHRERSHPVEVKLRKDFRLDEVVQFLGVAGLQILVMAQKRQDLARHLLHDRIGGIGG